MNTVYVSTYEELVDAINSWDGNIIHVEGEIDFGKQEIICRDPTDHELKTNCSSKPKHSRGKGKKAKEWDKRGR